MDRRSEGGDQVFQSGAKTGAEFPAWIVTFGESHVRLVSKAINSNFHALFLEII